MGKNSAKILLLKKETGGEKEADASQQVDETCGSGRGLVLTNHKAALMDYPVRTRTISCH